MVLANTDGSADMAQIVAAIRRELAADQAARRRSYTSLEGTFQAQEEASRTIGDAVAGLARR